MSGNSFMRRLFPKIFQLITFKNRLTCCMECEGANMPENVEDVCRLCLSKEGLMLPIFRSRISTDETTFRLKIMSCSSIEVFADDELPTKVCYLCVHQVEKFFQFQTMCENSDAILRSRLKENEISSSGHATNSSDIKNDCMESQEDCSGSEKSDFLSDFYESSESLAQDKIDFEVTTCFICSLVFESTDLLIDHIKKSHSGIKSYVCKKCELSFSYLNQFRNHLNTHHSLKCDQCDYVFKHKKNLQDHLKNHVKDSFLCKYCNKVFENLFQLKKHELFHLEKTCQHCSIELTSKEDYLSHSKECLQAYHCKFCDHSVQLKKDLIEHVNKCHDSFTLHTCNNCQITFTKPEDMKEHKCEPCEEETLHCKNCQANFTDESALAAHMSTVHIGEVLSCRFCTKKFNLKSSLRRHERSHSGMKPYQCKFCPRKFKDSSTCVVHTRTHTGEHPFQCQECNKDFKQLANLKMHTYRHHKKHQKSMEEKEVSQVNHEYDHSYTESILDNYSHDSMRNYQHFNESIPTAFNQSINMLISD